MIDIYEIYQVFTCFEDPLNSLISRIQLSLALDWNPPEWYQFYVPMDIVMEVCRDD